MIKKLSNENLLLKDLNIKGLGIWIEKKLNVVYQKVLIPKNSVDKSFFSEWNNGVNSKTEWRWKTSPDVKKALYNIYKDFVGIPIDKAVGNIALAYKRFYVSVFAMELGLNNNLAADSCNKNKINNINNTSISVKILLWSFFNPLAKLNLVQ